MSTNLLIVESPAKAKTLHKYLGKDYESHGLLRARARPHPEKRAVDTADDFAMHYEIIERNARHVNEITKAAKAAENIYLATDPDREGEAISWHLREILRERGALDNKTSIASLSTKSPKTPSSKPSPTRATSKWTW